MTEDCTISNKTISCKVAVPVMVTAANVVGQDKDAAGNTLTQLGFAVSLIEDADYSDTPFGQVIGQSIAAGTSVRKGTMIILTYSKGPKPIVTKEVPSIPAALYDAQSAEAIISWVKGILNGAGFYNLEFIAEDTTNTTNKKGLKSISPVSGTVINVEDKITIVYYTSQN